MLNETNMRIIILCEGKTESLFCKDVLIPHFGDLGISISRPRVKTSKDGRGGIVNYPKVRNDIINHVRHEPSALHTTMIDLFRLPNDFPGFEQAGGLPSAPERVKYLEEALEKNIREADELQGRQIRFIPYLQLHEFEALLFSEVENFEFYFSNEVTNSLADQLAEFSSPEEINDGPETAPSRRIAAAVERTETSGFRKTQHGVDIAELIGLATMREQCPHFNEWLTQLENSAE